MKFMACSDLHLTDKTPINRKDDYPTTIMNKFEEILKITKEKTENNLLVVAGDFVDSPAIPYKVTRSIIELLLKYETMVLAVPGQHCLRYHKSGLENTPLGILEAAEVVHILSSKKRTKIDGVTFIGSGWNEEPENKADVMVTHRMVTQKDPLFFGQEDFQTTHQLFHKYKWAKCIISGDNHLPFTVKSKQSLLVNCGSMVRSSKNQIKHKPKIWLINSDSWNVIPIELSIEPAKEVFDFSKIQIKEEKDEAKKKAEEDIDKFISSLTGTNETQPSFKNILKNVIKEVDPNEQVKEIINNIMEEIA